MASCTRCARTAQNCPAGRCARTSSPLHTGGRAFTSGEVSADVGGAILGSVAVGDANQDGLPEVYAADMEGSVYGWRADGPRFFSRGVEPGLLRQAAAGHPFVNAALPGQAQLHRTQHGFIGSPVLADLDGDGGSRR